MRQYIFEFPQYIAVELGLRLEEMLLLDYFYRFFSYSGSIRREWEGKIYNFITYKKIKADLPILGSQSTVRRSIRRLEVAGVIETEIELGRYLYITVNWPKIFRNGLEVHEVMKKMDRFISMNDRYFAVLEDCYKKHDNRIKMLNKK